MKEYKPLEKVKENPALKKEYMEMKPIDSQTIKAKTGNSFQRAKGIMQKAMARRTGSIKDKWKEKYKSGASSLEDIGDKYLKDREGMY
jgi:hypothetical protein